ncbi:Mediator of RNA polymerase II transcription subunit 14 [Pelomyxa schiedti]|nr:Mediator of RNA polymerase II transcription subunit 14 [Pelomyxa schiedti]
MQPQSTQISLPQLHEQQLVELLRNPQYGKAVLLSTLIHQVVQNAHAKLLALADSLAKAPDTERKREMLRYFDFEHQQFIKLLVLVKWCRKNPPIIERANAILRLLSDHNKCFELAANNLWDFTKNILPSERPAISDIPTAVDVLTTGSTNFIPRCIGEMSGAAVTFTNILPQCEVTARLENSIRFRLSSTLTPQKFTSIDIKHGRLICTVEREFRLFLTIEGSCLHWKLLRVQILVLGISSEVQQYHSEKLSTFLQRFIQPEHKCLVTLYEILHDFCNSLQLELAHNQAKDINTKSRTHSMKISYLESKSLTLYYWRDGQKMTANPQEGPFIRLSVNSWRDLELEHNPPIDNPSPLFTQKGVNLQYCLNQAMSFHSKKLLEKLCNQLKIHPITSLANVTTIEQYTAEQNKLQIILFNASCIIGVDMRTGKYTMTLPPGIASDIVQPMQEQLNNNVDSIGDIIAQLLLLTGFSLMFKIGHSLGLVPIHNLNELPTEKKLDGNALGFKLQSSWGNCYLIAYVDEKLCVKFSLLECPRSNSNDKLLYERSLVPSVTLACQSDQNFFQILFSTFQSALSQCKRLLNFNTIYHSIPREMSSSVQFISIQSPDRPFEFVMRNEGDITVTGSLIGDNAWQMTVKEPLVSMCTSLAASSMPFPSPDKSNGKITPSSQPMWTSGHNLSTSVTPHKNEWIFHYEKLPDQTLYLSPLRIFEEDFKSAKLILELEAQACSYIYAHPMQQISWKRCRPFSFTLDYKGSEFTVTASRSSPRINLITVPNTPTTTFLDAQLAVTRPTRQIGEILQSYTTTFTAMQKISSFFGPASPTHLPLDFNIIARSTDTLRVIFRYIWGLDMVVKEEFVVIKDAFSSEHPSELQPIPRFKDFLAKLSRIFHSVHIVESCSHREPSRSQVAFGVPTCDLLPVFASLHQYLSHLHLFRRPVREIKEFKDSNDFSDSATEELILRPNTSSLKFSLVLSNFLIELRVEDPQLSKEDSRSLEEFFTKKVIKEPYLSKPFVGLLHILIGSPIRSIKELVITTIQQALEENFLVEWYGSQQEDPDYFKFLIKIGNSKWLPFSYMKNSRLEVAVKCGLKSNPATIDEELAASALAESSGILKNLIHVLRTKVGH